MAGLFYEDLIVGREFKHEWTRTLTEADNMMFCGMTMNVQPLHIDAHYAAQTEFGKPLVNSLLTLGLTIGMSVHNTTLGTTVANLGMSEVVFPKPVFHGDTIHVTSVVLSRRESAKRPNVGIVEFEHTAWNQREEIVCRCKRSAMMKKRDAA